MSKEQLLCPVTFLHRTIVYAIIPRMHVRLCRAASRTRVSRSGLHQRAGRLARPHHLTTPRTTRPSALAAGSRVRTGLQRRGRLICCPGESGDIHPSLFLTHSIFVKEKFIFALVCTIVDAGHVFTTSKQTWLTRSRRFTAPQPVHLFELPLMRRSSFPSVYCGLVYIDTPGLHLSA